MSSAKQYNTLPVQIIPTQAVSGNVTSLPTNVFYKDNVGIQLVWTGTLAGTFSAQVSFDYNKDTGIGTWTSLPLSPAITASGTPDNAVIELNQTTAPYIRVVFTYSSGSGNLTGILAAKGV
jgi:hypothetical protein